MPLREKDTFEFILTSCKYNDAKDVFLINCDMHNKIELFPHPFSPTRTYTPFSIESSRVALVMFLILSMPTFIVSIYFLELVSIEITM